MHSLRKKKLINPLQAFFSRCLTYKAIEEGKVEELS